MKKNECNVVRDLMPLVLDRAASDDSRELVETHIASCEECRKQYDGMKADLPEDIRAEYEEEQKQFTDALKAIRKKKMKRRVCRVALAALICLVAALAGLFAYDALFWKMSVPVDNSLYSLSLCETKDGRYVITADTGRIDFSIMTESEDAFVDGKDIVYLRFQAAPIHFSTGSGNPEQKWEVMILENDGEDTIDELRQGTPGNYITIWKKGDPLPAASEEMERYFAMEKAYYQWIDSSYRDADGNVNIVVNDSEDEFFAWQDRLEDARKAVPEWN